MNYSKSTQRAIAKYGEEACRKAYKANRIDGEGPYSIAFQGLAGQTITHWRSADSAINAGAEILKGL